MKMRRIKELILDEAKRLFAMFLYLYILFALFNIHEYVILAQHQIEFTDYGVAVINAAIFAKVMLVAEDLRLGRRLDDRPLIYSVAFKSIVFMIVFICFREVEDIALGLWKGETIAASIPKIGGGHLVGIAAVGVITAFALAPYFAYREIEQIIGKDEFRSLILPRRANIKDSQSAARH